MVYIGNATTEPEEETEINPRMVRAGVEAFVEHDPRFEGLEEAVVRIFLEMRRAQQGPD